MRTVDDFAALRQAHRDGKSIRQIAKQFGVGRNTVRKALHHPEPIPYTLNQPRPAPTFGPFRPIVEAILHGLVEAFTFFGCVPRELWWDNPTTVAIHLVRGRRRAYGAGRRTLGTRSGCGPADTGPALRRLCAAVRPGGQVSDGAF